jgi:delta-aminolevulinic acid dehydratase/porphobilinogen synthase
MSVVNQCYTIVTTATYHIPAMADCGLDIIDPTNITDGCIMMIRRETNDVDERFARLLDTVFSRDLQP